VNLRQYWSAVQRWYAAHSPRDRYILLGVAVAAGLSLVYIALVEPLVHYRRAVAAEIAEGQEQIERGARFLAAADAVRAERDDLRQRLDQAKERLLPGGSGTLGAAALQERANSIAAEKGIAVQSTQVMKEEMAEPFRKVAIRLTLSGELKPFSEFVAGLEYGPQQLAIPFIEVSRRGAVPGVKGPRTLAATVEVTGYLLGEQAPKPAEAEPAETEPDASAVPGEPEGPPVPRTDEEQSGLPAVPPLLTPAPPPEAPLSQPQPPQPEPPGAG
jgi:type II secretory pathway component PulM